MKARIPHFCQHLLSSPYRHNLIIIATLTCLGSALTACTLCFRLLTKVTVYYHTFTSENAFAVPLYDGNSVLNNVGRINGIYLGVSFLVILRLLDTVVRGIHFHRDGTFTCYDESDGVA
ncbi:hypothetical protein HPB51_016471 [Rhipicephalus microplus]|uniref:Uncharacterized protein n=1 Tax=Rhipicephalus microplus TaxID=6941 RepID=A0A9J6DWP9_RHIMP|nr:hypothetical protein HPB51_016471 [Rhipicephalus microplus]